jgi:hypothetical protein
VNDFERDIKQRKYETDGGRDLEAENKKNVRDKMKVVCS